jgi:hypothetical protein
MLDPIAGELIRASKATTVRYEDERPGTTTLAVVTAHSRPPTHQPPATNLMAEYT